MESRMASISAVVKRVKFGFSVVTTPTSICSGLKSTANIDCNELTANYYYFIIIIIIK